MSVVVLITRAEEARPLVHWAALLGRARGRDVVALYAVVRRGAPVARELSLEESPPDDDLGRAIVDACRRVRAVLPTLPTGEGVEIHMPSFAVLQLEGPSAARAILRQLRERGAELLVLDQRGADGRAPESSILPERLFRRAPCHALRIRAGDDEAETAERILVPTAGGPHAGIALALGGDLAAASGGRVTALHVQTEVGEDAEAVAAKVLERAIALSPSRHRERIESKVVLAGSILEGIREEVAGYDLVLLGTSSRWFIRRILGRSLPEAVLEGPGGASVAVVRRSIPLTTRLEWVAAGWLRSVVPQMHRPARIALVERLRDSSHWNFDFVFLTCLSTLIASLGLVAANVAVVIGAMLVAPLMTPLIGAGLALVHGNLVLLRQTLRTTAAGFLLALAVGCLVGLVLAPSVTQLMASRGRPDLLDLAVAFASGMAAAYAIGRPGLLAALPGVAIAASLVPPIATAGLSLVTGRLWLAAGAALLFFTNMIAIALGAAVSLFAVGLRSEHLHRRQNRWVRRLVILLFVLAALIVILLGFWLAGAT